MNLKNFIKNRKGKFLVTKRLSGYLFKESFLNYITNCFIRY
ncbi:hypothetical protein NT01EI_0878 [Edwardsiella ictaluri 93-146]|uniref:Uncharacterized protein n=1 Tax=Edwardsiella ictaluri (strain 93-146) TaxID=634503 RepID=C5B7U7_EDWI9|nr:hypothetical protein NT01EI_0878 [Edwardsiella ictaluri 93-146]